ncbi:MAG: VanW family protein [Eubacterium sp.]|nr:VanW family protein [Eubacterium sp.]
MKRRINGTFRKLYILSAFMMCLPMVGRFAAPDDNTSVVYAEGTTIRNGVTIDGVDVGGLTREEAKEKISKKVEELGDTKVVLKNDTYGNVETTLGELGLTVDYDEVIDEAVNVGNTGDIFKRYKENKNIENGKGVGYTSIKSVNQEKLSSVVNAAIGSRINEGAETTLIKKDDGTVKVTASNVKMSVDYKTVTDAINGELSGEKGISDITTDLVVSQNNDNSADSLAEITSLLGSYTTDYESAEDRMKNVERAAEILNGTIMYPGEQLSFYWTISPINGDNGFYKATVFIGDGTGEDYGGGVCQVSTTLYNALLRAELQIDERDNHGQPVHYVDLSYDAAIAGGYLDLVFTNSSSAPIYIESICDGVYITFNIYGKETRPSNRTIEFESYITEVLQPGKDVIKDDETLEPGEEKVTQEAREGYETELWKFVYEDGELVDKVLINTSTYSPAAKHISRNPKEPEDKDKDKDKDKGKDKDKDKTEASTEQNTAESGSTEKTTEGTTETATPSDAAKAE